MSKEKQDISNSKNVIENFTPVNYDSSFDESMGGLTNVSFMKTAFCSGATTGGTGDTMSGGGMKKKKLD